MAKGLWSTLGLPSTSSSQEHQPESYHNYYCKYLLHYGEGYFLVINPVNGKYFTDLIAFVMVEDNLRSADGERIECSPSKTMVVSCTILPDVQQAEDLTQNTFEECCLMKMTGQTPCGNLVSENFGSEPAKLHLDIPNSISNNPLTLQMIDMIHDVTPDASHPRLNYVFSVQSTQHWYMCP